VFVSFSKVETIHKSPSLIRRGAIILAVIFMALSLTRDGLLFWAYGTEPGEDGHSYINRGEILFDRTASTESGIPPRTFPYLFINAITRSYESQDLLAITQYFIAAIAIGAITYVLARRNWLIAAAVGLVLALDLVWGLYSRQAMTESLFISFHLIALAVLIHHYYLRDAAPRWLLILAGLLFFWAFLMRGSGIVLILPTYFIYIFLVKSWRKALWVLIGASVLGLSIATFNLWRWGEFGLLGDQHDTLASALFSYNLFSPENGAESAKLHSDLAACMPYIDYDDVPRYRNVFIYIHLNPCLLGEDTYTIDARNDLTSRVGAALQELIRSRPFDFGREVLAEIITLVAFPVSEEWFPFAFSPAESCVDEACTEYVVLKLDRDNQALIDLNKILTVPRQIYQSIAWTSSHSEVVLFAAWAMLGLFALLVSRGSHRFILLICGGFIVYHFLTTALVHTFKSRYTVSLIGFYTVASVIIGYYILTSVRSVILNMRWRRAAGYAVIGYCVLYLFFANPALRVNVTAPITASVMPAVANMFRKFGVSDDEYRLYDHMASLDGDAATISWQPPTSLHQSNFREEYADLYSKWIQNYLPGYLHLAGIEYLVVSDGEWNTLSVEAQAVFNNPQHYMLEMELKTANGEEGALYRVVGDQFGTIILHEQDDFVLFEQPDGAIHVLQLDENREGRFIGRIEPWRLRNGAYQPDEVDSWRVELMSDAQEEFTISVIDTIDRITYPIDYTLIYQPLRCFSLQCHCKICVILRNVVTFLYPTYL